MLASLVVTVSGAKVSSDRLIVEMHRSARDLNIDIFEVRPKESIPSTAQRHNVFGYSSRAPISRLGDRAAAWIGQSQQLGGFGILRNWLASKLRRRFRPLAQELDRALWPLPPPDELDTLTYELSSLMARYDRSYIVFLDEQSLPKAIELSDRLNFDAAGSTELFDLITGVGQLSRSV